MIKFFRRFRHALINDSKFSKYLIYAIGEIALVMMSILLALQVNNWNEGRKTKLLEKKLLREYNAELGYNIDAVANFRQDMINRRECCVLLLETIDQKRPYADTLSTCYHVLTRSLQNYLSQTTYKSIESQGIDIISDDSLKLRIINLHALTYGRLDNRIENQVSNIKDYGRPILRHRLRTMGNSIFIPVDYDNLMNDVSLWNILMTLHGNYNEIILFLNEMETEMESIDDLIVEFIN